MVQAVLEQWRAADEALLTHLQLTSRFGARFLTGRGPGVGDLCCK